MTSQLCLRFLAMQKLAEEKKAEALKQMNSLPQVELDLKRHGPDGYHGHCREPRATTANNRQHHPKQVGGRTFITLHSVLFRGGHVVNIQRRLLKTFSYLNTLRY